jgi:hypothetical protein
MKQKFQIGDMVNLTFFGLGGSIIAIKKIPDSILEFADFAEDFILYEVRIQDGVHITTSEEGLEIVTPGRSSDNQVI